MNPALSVYVPSDTADTRTTSGDSTRIRFSMIWLVCPVVEDDFSIRELLRLHLDLSGFAIDEAEDGRKGATANPTR